MDKIIIDGLAFALPLFIIAVGGIYGEKSGIFMLSLEGFQGFGAFIGALMVAILSHNMGGTEPYFLYIAMAAAMVGGMLFASIHALMCVKFRANHVISGVVSNILAVAVTTFLTSQINRLMTGDSSNRFQLGASVRFDIPFLSDIPFLGVIFQRVYPFQLVIIGVAIFAWYILDKTRFGMRIHAAGENPHSLDAAGGEVNKTRFIAVLIGGALSGLGGIFLAYSVSANFSPNIYMGYGFLAVAAMIFGNWKIHTTLAACLFFGLARSGGYQLLLFMGLSSSFNDLFLTLPYILTLLLLVFFSKHNQPPRAAGAFFDKGKR